MSDHLGFIDGLLARLDGPMSFRFLMQPTIALLLAIRDGRRDAQDGRAPFFWGLFTDPQSRGEMLHSGGKSISKVFIVAVALDLVFQYLVFHELPVAGGALLAGVILALVPYLLIRGLANRLSQKMKR